MNSQRPQCQDAVQIVLWNPLAAWPAGQRWLWVILAVWVCLHQGPDFIRTLYPPRDKGIDFYQDWASARNFFSGLPIYTSHTLTIPRYLGFPVNPQDDTWVKVRSDVNTRPPTSVLLVLPLARLDYPEAVLVWNLVSLGMLTVSLWLVGRHLGITFSPWSVYPAVTLLLLAYPFRHQVLQAQLNLLLLLLVTGVWVAERSGRLWWAGVLLGTATAIKLFPGFLFLYFTLRRQWKAVAAGAISLAALNGLTAIILGFKTYRSYFEDVLPQLVRLRSQWVNASLVGFWTKLFDPASPQLEPLWRSPTTATIGALLSCILVVIVLARIVRQAETRAASDQAFGLAVTAMLLVSPITWDHYFVLLLISLAVVWIRLPLSPTRRTFFTLVVGGLFVPAPLLYDRFIPGGYWNGVAAPLHTASVLSYGCYALLGLFILGILALRDEKAQCEQEK